MIDYSFIHSSGKITPEDLPAHLRDTSYLNKTYNNKQLPVDRRQQLLDALHQSGENKSKAARILGISRVTLWKQLKKIKITVDKAAHQEAFRGSFHPFLNNIKHLSRHFYDKFITQLQPDRPFNIQPIKSHRNNKPLLTINSIIKTISLDSCANIR